LQEQGDEETAAYAPFQAHERLDPLAYERPAARDATEMQPTAPLLPPGAPPPVTCVSEDV